MIGYLFLRRQLRKQEKLRQHFEQLDAIRKAEIRLVGDWQDTINRKNYRNYARWLARITREPLNDCEAK